MTQFQLLKKVKELLVKDIAREFNGRLEDVDDIEDAESIVGQWREAHNLVYRAGDIEGAFTEALGTLDEAGDDEDQDFNYIFRTLTTAWAELEVRGNTPVPQPEPDILAVIRTRIHEYLKNMTPEELPPGQYLVKFDINLNVEVSRVK